MSNPSMTPLWRKPERPLPLRLPLLCLCLFLISLAYASDESEGGFYAAYTFGPEVYFGEGVALEMHTYLGFEEVVPGLDVRAGAGFLAGDRPAFHVAGDALYTLGGEAEDLTFRVGVGPRFILGRLFDVGVGAFVQLELPHSGRASLFLEPGLNVYFLDVLRVAPGLSIGARYRF